MHLKIHEDGPFVLGNSGCNPIFYRLFSDYLKEGYKADTLMNTLDMLLEKYSEDTYCDAELFYVTYYESIKKSWYFFYNYVMDNDEMSMVIDNMSVGFDEVEKFFKFSYHYLKTKSLEDFRKEYAQYIDYIRTATCYDYDPDYLDLYIDAPASAVDMLSDIDWVARIYKSLKSYENDLMLFASYLPQALYIDYYDFDDEWDPHVILNGKKYGGFTAEELDKSPRYKLVLTYSDVFHGQAISIKRNNQNLVLMNFGKYSIVYDLNDANDVAKIREVVGLNKKYFSDEFYEFIMRDNLIVELKEARDYYYKLPKLIIEDSYDDYIEPTVYYNIDAPYDPDDVNLLLNDDSE